MNVSASIPLFPQLGGFYAAQQEALRPPTVGRRAIEMLGVSGLVGILFWFTLRDTMLTGLISGIVVMHESAVWVTAWLLGLKRRSNTWLTVVEASAPGTSALREALLHLSGPLAGLAVAVAFTWRDRHGSHPVYGSDGYVIALFNGFMLLPIFPLDGGRFFHTLFFARAPSKGVLFRLAAAVGLIGAAVYTKQLWPLIFALVPLYAFKSCLTLELLAQSLRLRERGILPSDDRLLEELARTFPRERKSDKMAARAVRLKVLFARKAPGAAAATLVLGLYLLAAYAAASVLWFPNFLG